MFRRISPIFRKKQRGYRDVHGTHTTLPLSGETHGEQDVEELCRVCSSTEVWDLLNSATDDKVSGPDIACWSVPLGPWSVLQSRASECTLCRAVIWMLRERSVERINLRPRDCTVEQVNCGLRRDPRAYRHDSNHGYSRIEILLTINGSSILETGTNLSPFRLDGFQVSTTLLREKEMDSDVTKNACPSVPRPRLRPELCNYNLVRSWLEICDDDHQGSCIIHLSNPTGVIRLVDVHTGAIIPFLRATGSNFPEYVSLSWVWGSARGCDGLTLDRLPYASTKGFLNMLRLPIIISDAILFLQRLGMRYLWVDLLCIVQDDIADKGLYVPLMGSIYTASKFTIIANGRNGALDGLPGVRAATRPKKQQVVHYDKLKLVSFLNAEFNNCSNEEQDPPWQGRAWTLQEKLLSPRCLIFGSDQMYWECLKASFCEETEFEVFESGTDPVFWDCRSIFSQDLIRHSKEKQLDDHRAFCIRYSYLVTSYNRRDLTFDADALNAFQGILNTLSDYTGIDFLWGLPCILFEQNLLWSALSGRKRAHYDCPSWSWLNYQFASAVEQKEDLNSTLAIKCYRRIVELLAGSEDTFSIRPVIDLDQYPTLQA